MLVAFEFESIPIYFASLLFFFIRFWSFLFDYILFIKFWFSFVLFCFIHSEILFYSFWSIHSVLFYSILQSFYSVLFYFTLFSSHLVCTIWFVLFSFWALARSSCKTRIPDLSGFAIGIPTPKKGVWNWHPSFESLIITQYPSFDVDISYPKKESINF